MDITNNLDQILNTFVNKLGTKNPAVIKKFFIGKDKPIEAAAIYINGITNKDIIDRDVLKPLMLNVSENTFDYKNLSDYLCKRYISMCDTYVEKNIDNAVLNIRRGKTTIVINNVSDFIIVDTSGGVTRGISEPINESSLAGSKEGFVESLEINLGILKKRIKDRNLSIELFTIGRRTQNDLAIVYIDDIVDKDILNNIKNRITAIDVDSIQGTGVVEQLIEKHTYTVFPQVLTTERPDKVVANMTEGRISILLDGSPLAAILPVIFSDFFQASEDYNERTLLSSFTRLLRMISVFVIISLPSIYLTFIRFNAELIPIKFVVPIIQSRKGIPLPPLLEILSMELTIEFLREGGLRLPSKIGQTLSVVGGFIIGDAAIRARIVSPATIIIVGLAAISTFIIPNYEMSLSIRLIRFPMLILSNTLGALGIATGWYLLLVHLYSLDSFGVPYFFTNKYRDLKDILIRVPIWKMNNRPESIPNTNPIRQTNFRKRFRRKNNEKSK